MEDENKLSQLFKNMLSASNSVEYNQIINEISKLASNPDNHSWFLKFSMEMRDMLVERINDRYFDEVSKSFQHLPQCHFGTLGICTCGLLCDFESLEIEDIKNLFPNFITQSETHKNILKSISSYPDI